MENISRNSIKQLIIFKLTNEEFGVDISEVKEIIKFEEITKLPQTEDYILGITNLRGKAIVVMDLEKKLSLSQQKITKDSRIIISNIKNTTIGMVVNSVTEVLRISENSFQPTPKIIQDKINKHFIEGVVILDNRLIILLNLWKILEEKDLETIRKIPDKKNNEEDTLLKKQDNASDMQTKQAIVKNEKEFVLINEENRINQISTQQSLPLVFEKKPEHTELIKLEVPKRYTESTKKIVDAPYEFHFITHDNGRLKNVNELHKYISTLDEYTFKNYVNEEKNDFYNWIKHVIKDEILSEKIKNIKDKRNITKEILQKIKENI